MVSFVRNDQQLDEVISYLESKRQYLSSCSQDLVALYNNNEARLYDLAKYVFPANVITVFSTLFNTDIHRIISGKFWVQLCFTVVIIFSIISVIGYVVAYFLPTLDIKTRKLRKIKEYDDKLVELIISGTELGNDLENEIYRYTKKLDLLPSWIYRLKICSLFLSITSFVVIMFVVLFHIWLKL